MKIKNRRGLAAGIISLLSGFACMILYLFLIAYSVWKAQYFIVIAVTLCAVTLFILIAFLCINLYLEKRA